MKAGWLDIELKSDMCTATGDSAAGLIDTEIAHEYGLPVIPAKRIKGALGEVGKELLDWGLIEEEQLADLFGLAGQASSGRLQVYDAHLYDIPGYGKIEDYEELCSQLKRHQLKENEVLTQFTEIRTRTAIDIDSSVAKTGTLRSMRVVNKGIGFRCRLELADDGGADAAAIEETLGMCVKGLRQLGLASTRGYGEVRCELSPLKEYKLLEDEDAKQSNDKQLIPTVSDNGMVIVPFRLELEQPVMIAGRDGLYHSCEDWIPGSALLGAMAAMYVADHQLGERAHEDEAFSRIFLRGGVQFGYALPLVVNDPASGKVFAPCPAMWQQVKNTDKGYDLSTGSPSDELLRSIRKMVYLDRQGSESALVCYQAGKQVRMHHARARNRAIGRALGAELTAAEREGEALAQGAANRGQLYQYVSLEAGQQFFGTLRGTARDITAVLACVHRRGDRLRIGRSRTAEYGNVRFFMEGTERGSYPVLSPEGNKRQANRLALHLVTPMLLLDEAGRPDPDPHWLMEQMNSKLDRGAKVQSQRLKYTVLSGFNAKWRMPKPHRAALDAGSSIIITTEKAVSPKELEAVLWGWNCGEGDGQIRAIPLPDEQNAKQEAATFTVSTLSSADVSGLAPDETSSRHPFLAYLYRCKEQAEQQRQARLEGAKAAEQVDEQALAQVGQTKLQQLRAWAGPEGSYEQMKNKVDELKKDSAKEACQKIIILCEGKSKAFIESYLRMLELKVRLRT